MSTAARPKAHRGCPSPRPGLARRAIGQHDDQQELAAPALETLGLQQPPEQRVRDGRHSNLGRQSRPNLLQCVATPSGTGKSHLLIGLGTAAAQAGFRVRYVLATKLANELVEAADERQLVKTIARYGRVDLLCIDELGYMELDRPGAEMLFQVLTEREERNSIAIASNEPFSGWTKTFTDPRLCAAIVDRVTFGGNIIETGTDSYRLAHTKAKRAASRA
jgi:hypothetical protein